MTPEAAEQLTKAAQLKQRVNGIAQKVADLDLQMNDHQLVLNTFKGMDDSRKCWRLVGGVLVEKSVGIVRPNIDAQRKLLEGAIGKLKAEMVSCEKQADEINKKYGYTNAAPSSRSAGSAASSSAGSSSGVLV